MFIIKYNLYYYYIFSILQIIRRILRWNISFCVNLTCYRYLLVVMPFNLLGLRSGDILYNPNPLYHTAGGMLGVGFAILKGIPTVLRTKFSVSAYWTDCIKYNCTVGDLQNFYTL